jgi:hypothetical protein
MMLLGDLAGGACMLAFACWAVPHSPSRTQHPPPPPPLRPAITDWLAGLQDKDSRVLWWVISACHPRFSTPGRHEARGTGKKSSWAKNRNLRLG